MSAESNSAGQKLDCAELLIEYLALEGVAHVFGVPGSANAHTLLALGRSGRPPDQQGIEYVICRQETGAAYMADGYARVTGGLATVLVTAGPGAMNAVTGTVNAHTSRTPMLVLTGEVAQQWYGKAYLQEGVDADLDTNAVYANACRYSAVVSAPENFATLLQHALRDARSLPGAATHLSLPDNIMMAQVPDGTTVPDSPSEYRVRPISSDRSTMQAIFDGLMSAEYPLLFLGNGARRALRDTSRRNAFVALIERLALPVITSPDGKGLFPETHDLSLRNYGLAQCEWPGYYLKPSSIDPGRPDRFGSMLVLASELGELATISPSTDAANVHYPRDIVPEHMFAHVDENQAVIGRDYAITHGLVAEAAHAIDQLIDIGNQTLGEAASADDRRAFVAQIKDEKSPFRSPEARTSPDAPIKPQALMQHLQAALAARPEPAHIWVDAGNCVGWCMQYLVIDPPDEIHSALAMGPMGFGVGSVVGGKIGAPDFTSISVVGDGAFMMHGSEVSTAAAHQVGAVWVVLNDNQLNMVAQGMQDFFPDKGPWNSLYHVGDPDLGEYSRGLGADAYDVTSPDEATEAFAAALELASEKNKPQVIVAHIDVSEVPPYYPPSVG